MKPIKYFLPVVSVLILLACNAVTGLVSSSTPVVIVVTATPNPSTALPAPTPTSAVPESLTIAREKIQHIVIIMQENRSFDSYFGTYPGADGLPRSNGKFTTCVNDPATGNCVYPYHDAANLNYGGPHGQSNAAKDIDNGRMDGFITEAEQGKAGCETTDNPDCGGGGTDVMGYHDAREIPNYWTLAENFVLQDHLFEPNSSWSLPAHLFMVSEWSAKCSIAHDPMSCINALQAPGNPPDFHPQ
ncbi:MAG TPA: alkaline phosphatase family protein [Anaerolineales bacterium]|nr:alkaline phosphatase family protein [Anaerolineales bacterium]